MKKNQKKSVLKMIKYLKNVKKKSIRKRVD